MKDGGAKNRRDTQYGEIRFVVRNTSVVIGAWKMRIGGWEEMEIETFDEVPVPILERRKSE